MESIHYVDIFATKGIEYLLVIGYLLLLVLFWQILNHPSKALYRRKRTEKPSISPVAWFHLLEGLFFHPGHSWALPENGNIVRVGMDDFAQKLLGKPRSIKLPQIGTRVKQGEYGWQLEIDSKTIDMLSPVEGEVVAINEEIIKSPDLVCQDPYKKGWLFKVKVSRLKANLRNLLTGRLAIAWMEETVNQLRRKMTGNLGIVLQDGGILVSGFAKALSPENWDDIAREFLLSK